MSDQKLYNIIYADPPWDYKVWSKKGEGRTARSHYATLSLEEIAALPIRKIAAKDCALFMWVTYPHLAAAFDVIKAWGFTYKTVAFTWIKLNKKNNRLFVGMGHYTRANAEVVLLSTKGKSLPRQSKNVPQVILSKIGRHSEKPAEVRNRIVQLFGDFPRLELFARSNPGFFPDIDFAGWDVYGNEVNNSISFLEGTE